MLKQLWLVIKALGSKLKSTAETAPSFLLNAIKQSPKILIPALLFTLRLLVRFIVALPQAIYNLLKMLALALGCAYLTLDVMGGLSQIPGPPVSSIQVPKGLEPLKDSPVYDAQRSIVRLSVNGQFMCSGVVIGSNYILTASHCIVDEQTGLMRDEVVTIQGDNGRVEVMGRTAGVNLRMDWGLIHGNFSSIPASHVLSTDVSKDKVLRACGFPQGNHKIYCTILEPGLNDALLIKTRGIVWPGMSGGPVFDETGTVVGLNIRVYELGDARDVGGSGISPTIGILANFGIGD